ncbi:MAG: 3-hydroxybutyryl-CoA dehydrogenase [Candidatus Sericytochromatia bacterium]|nr:3-hydroxybutyryl-CoA dehydrogenase [Candidatus Sericytochromatia bacterium]
MTTNIEHVGVVGAGQMGSGIAQVFAAAGLKVTVYDAATGQLEKAAKGITGSLAKFVEKGKLPAEERDAALARLSYSNDLASLAVCDLVVEAIVEQLEVKQDVFRKLSELVRPEAILASNTSSLPITQLAAAVVRPERFIGMHFMNPVPLMQLVEVIRGLKTSDDVHGAVMALARRLGKTPVTVNDAAGFVSNRILLPMINEAFFALQEGVASAEDIDTVMELGMNHPMGPLTLADFIGLDTCLSIMEVLHAELGDDKYRPCPLLRKYVRAGALGRKSGEGVFGYAPATAPVAVR